MDIRGAGQRLRARLSFPVDAAWLAAFRILYGLALAVSMLRFIGYGWVDRLFVTPRMHFKYYGFEWVEALPGPEMHALFWLLMILALAMALGLWFRVAAPAFALGLTYTQLIDVAAYLNHYYLACLLAWLLAISPANRMWSVDAWLRKRRGQPTTESCATAWLVLFRVQVGLVYTFAGLAKAQSDWLLHGQPLRIWLGANTDLPILGELFTISWVPLFMSWFGFLFDTSVVTFLSFRKTRPYAYAVVILFHVATRLLFPIGMFPVIMVGAALVFFSASWPRVVLGRLAKWLPRLSRVTKVPELSTGVRPLARPWAYALALYCLVQLLLPMRAWAYPGNVLWHEQGMRFAWRVMLRAKGGGTTFVVTTKTPEPRTFYVSPREFLNDMQEFEMSSQPDLILQFAHFLRDEFARRGHGDVSVRVESFVSLNGRRAVQFIDPTVDLTQIKDGLAPLNWVLPAPTEPPPHTRPVR